MKLLIAEDEKSIRQGIASLPWEEVGINQIYEAENGILAQEILRKETIDIVISDIKMPGVTGLELAEHIREKDLDVAIILLTGFSEFEYAQKAIQNGVMDYLLKPVSPKSIMETVAMVYERLEKKRYRERVVRQYERDADSVNFGEQIQHHFRGVNEVAMAIIQDMARNFMNEISLQSMAEKYHFSMAYLSRMIRKETGYSFSEFLNSMRLLEAVLLIQEDTDKIGHAGEKAGFKDSRYFSQLFKRVFNCTPSEYRKNDKIHKVYNIKEILEVMQENK